MSGPFIDPLGRRITIADGHLQADREVCDFCLADNPVWEYPATDMPIVGHSLIGRTDDAWAACQACHDLLAARELGQLVERCVQAHAQIARDAPGVAMPALAVARRTMRENLLRFTDARTGPPRRYR